MSLHSQHVGQGHYFCQNCQHAVNSRFGGCRTCGTPLSGLMLFDELANGGFFNEGGGWGGGPIGFDPVDDSIAFNLGDGLAVEPDGQIDVETPFGDFGI